MSTANVPLTVAASNSDTANKAPDIRLKANSVHPTDSIVHIDGLYAQAKGRTRIIIGFDDSLRNTYDVAFDIMKNYGLVGTLRLATRRLEGNGGNATEHLSEDQVTQLCEAGWSIVTGSTDDSAWTTFGSDDGGIKAAFENFNIAQQDCIDKGWGEYLSRAGYWMSSSYTADLAAKFRRGDAMNGPVEVMFGSEALVTHTRFGLLEGARRYCGSRGADIDTVAMSLIEYVDKAVANGSDGSLHFHAVVPDDAPRLGNAFNVRRSAFEAACARVAALRDEGKLDQVNCKDWLEVVNSNSFPN